MSNVPVLARLFEEHMIREIAHVKTTSALIFYLDKIEQEEARWSESPEVANYIATIRQHVDRKLAELTRERQAIEGKTASPANANGRSMEKVDSQSAATTIADLNARIKRLEAQR
jgi:hypothetical protein